MAKTIKYKFLSSEVNHGTEEKPNIVQLFLNKSFECKTQAEFDTKYPFAEKEAVGKIDVTGEFDPVPVAEPTADDVLNALLGVK